LSGIPRTRLVSPGTVSSILVIKLRAVGDVLLASIVLQNLRAAFPDARIDVLTERAGKDVVAGHSAVNEVVVYDRSRMSGLQLILSVRKRHYDLVIDLFGNPRTALVTRLSGARVRVGYRFRGRAYAYTIIAEPRGDTVHNTQFNLDALEAMGVPIVDRNLRFTPHQEHRLYVSGFLEREGLTGRTLVALNAGGGWYTKRWRNESFAELADRIAAHYGWTVVLPWGPGQLPDVEAIAGRARCKPFVPPATSLPQLAALFEKCAFVVSNDSGPMHLAAAVGTPVLGIFGPTRPELQGPYGSHNATVRLDGLDCLGCNLTKCPIGNPCMINLSVDTVLESFGRLVGRNTTPAPL
jgi:heptosyltransferase-3